MNCSYFFKAQDSDDDDIPDDVFEEPTAPDNVVPEASRDVLGGAAGQSQSSMERTVTSSSSSRNISDADSFDQITESVNIHMCSTNCDNCHY